MDEAARRLLVSEKTLLHKEKLEEIPYDINGNIPLSETKGS